MTSFRKPPTGPARSGRPDDKLRGYPECIITGQAELALRLFCRVGVMDSGFLADPVIRPDPLARPRNDGHYCSWSFTFSSPLLTHSSSTPGEPDMPTPPMTSLPDLIG